MNADSDNGTADETRYERVRRILDEASGGSEVLYQGIKEFWNLPLEELLVLELYGFRMIAPKESGGECGTTSPGPHHPAPPAHGSSERSCCGEPEAPAQRGAIVGHGLFPSDQTAAGVSPTGSGRGARSWLIKALRGEFPFDNSHFPPFLWGDKATPVLPPDIQFIENWIDDGCPADDEQHDPAPQGAGDRPRVKVFEPGVIAAHTNAFRDQSNELNLRLNALYLTPEEQAEIRCAVRALKDLNDYPQDNRSFNAWAKIHGDHCQHGWEQFLTWHRIFLFEFERGLQQIVPGVTLPYWEWTNPYFQQGMIPTGRQSGIIPPLYRCWINAELLSNLKSVLSAKVFSALQSIETDGTDTALMYNSLWELFVQAGLNREDYLAYNAAVVDQLVEVNPMWHPLRFPGMYYKQLPNPTDRNIWSGSYELDAKGDPILSPATLGTTFHHHFPLAEDIEQILDIPSWPNFGGGHTANQSFGALSQNPHNTGHIWLGGANPYFDTSTIGTIATFGPSPLSTQPQYGDMFYDLLAAYDPMFWAHHSNVDRLFYEWQQRHPGVNPDDLNDVLLPFGARVEQALSAEKLGYRYASSSRLMVADSGREMKNIKTDRMDLDAQMLHCCQHAEITFHNVRRSSKSYFVRVFLNLPEANADTPIDNNDHYVGRFARFGHGGCVGGPGHCDPPPKQREHFWRRPRHHNDNHCYSLDATDTVRTLLKKGEKQFHINVVTVDPSGSATEGLQMGALSLNFYD